MTESRRIITGIAILMLAFSGPRGRQNHQISNDVLDASLGFPFRIISETKSTIGPSTWFVLVNLTEDKYSRQNLESIWHYFCRKYTDKTWKLDLRIQVNRSRKTVNTSARDNDPKESDDGFAANFLRQGDGALAGGGDNEILIYLPDLDKPKETKRIVIKGKDPFDTYAYSGNRDSDFVAAAAKGDRKKFENLLAEGVDINARDRFQGTALIEASTSGFVDLVQALLRKGADVNARNEGGWTALMTAASEGHNQVVRLLLERGADLNAKNLRGMSALTRAIYDNHVDTVKLLLAEGAEIEFKDGLGYTPLILAAEKDPEIVNALLQKGANKDAQNNYGETPLMRAYHEETVTALLEKGATINTQDAKGNTALIHAIQLHNTVKVRILLESGADVTIRNQGGATALAIAQAYRNQGEVIRLLKEAGAKE